MTAIPTESVTLQELAQFMQDGAWLDLGTEDGVLERVRITEIRVRPRGDDLMLRQEWVIADQRLHREIEIDAESVWRAKPTRLDIFEVRSPYKARDGVAKPDAAFGAITTAIAMHEGFDIQQLTGMAPVGEFEFGRLIACRHVGILLQYGMTAESMTEASFRFGYSSPQPYYTAREKLEKNDGGIATLLRKCVQTCAHQLGGVPCKPLLDRDFPELAGVLGG
jgi:hypothetical protein